ncbi:hypothetical protein BU23DRAFT_575111 [Bimuria novae-zelandiae CBS 107.79]|uniref:Uncharacterized protein n=1 Tax=Bimuria novae-zelandiae CBS 107.79 TaxID=1447943 RepID=A0A6A5UMJ5_9PLEO|nr:hypothetical protein BU23DRAFT_575111 [Bimuria novae-zelandiae CBS 107.79]
MYRAHSAFVPFDMGREGEIIPSEHFGQRNGNSTSSIYNMGPQIRSLHGVSGIAPWLLPQRAKYLFSNAPKTGLALVASAQLKRLEIDRCHICYDPFDTTTHAPVVLLSSTPALQKPHLRPPLHRNLALHIEHLPPMPHRTHPRRPTRSASLIQPLFPGGAASAARAVVASHPREEIHLQPHDITVFGVKFILEWCWHFVCETYVRPSIYVLDDTGDIARNEDGKATLREPRDIASVYDIAEDFVGPGLVEDNIEFWMGAMMIAWQMVGVWTMIVEDDEKLRRRDWSLGQGEDGVGG